MTSDHENPAVGIPAWEPREGGHKQDMNGNVCVRETEKGASMFGAAGAVQIEWRCGCRVYSGITRTRMAMCGGTPAPKPAPNFCVRETEKCAPVISAKGAVWAEWRCGCRVYGNITKTKMKQCGRTPAPKPAPNFFARFVTLAAISAVLLGASVGALLAGVHGISSPTWYVVALVVNIGNFIGASVLAARAHHETGRHTR